MSTEVAVLDQAAEPAKLPAGRDAIIFVPGLMHNPETTSIDIIALRMAHALNRQAHTRSASFLVSEGREEDYDGGKTRTVTVSRKDGDQETPLFDLYGFDYRQSLIGPHEKKRPIFQALSIGWLLVRNFGTLMAAVRRRSKSGAQKVQTMLAVALFLLLMVYMFVLLFTIAGTVHETVQQFTQSAQQQADTAKAADSAPAADPGAAESGSRPGGPWAKTKAWFGRAWDETIDALQLLVVALAAAGLWTKTSMKEMLARVSGEVTCAAQYLEMGERSGAVAGQFASLLEYIAEKEASGNVTYRNVHVVSFSFGTVVALDAIFPHSTLTKSTLRIDSLVTVGCPFDFIRTYWPEYFERREAWPNAPRHWVNVYAPADVLGSDFKDDTPEGSVDRGIAAKAGDPRRPTHNRAFGRDLRLGDSFKDIVTLVGFKVHALYWEKGQTFDVNCFDHIVREVYEGDFALS
jgi:hypothetical protein